MKKAAFILGAVVLVALGFVFVRWKDSYATKRQMMSVASNAMSLRPQISALHLWPTTQDTARYSSSTEYFNALLRDSRIVVSPHTFTAPGLIMGTNQEIRASENAWCILVRHNADGSDTSVPYLFTRNIRTTRLSSGIDATLLDQPPFGKEGAIVIKSNEVFFVDDTNVKSFFADLDPETEILRP